MNNTCTGFVEAVCISPKKGMIKHKVEAMHIEKNWGAVEDAHAGTWHRQISMLAGESIDLVKAKLPRISHGVFAENIVTRGIDLNGVAVGDCFRIDDEILLQVTQIGKECHNAGCAIKKATGDCIMPREGIFCKVLRGGTVKPGSPITLESQQMSATTA